MYHYDSFDTEFLRERIAEFRDQVDRRLAGELTEEQFRPLRLMNGVYLQLHAYMLRVAIPYGVLNARQMRRLARIARMHDRGFGHFTTRQNVQFNWIALGEMPQILEELADVEMHAIQTSGNCIRNVTTDPFAGAAADEVVDPRPYAEILRQWSSLHPEFSFLPRKFKIAVTGAPQDRVALQVHNIGLEAKHDGNGHVGFAVWVGGGQGRTPMLARKIRDFLPAEDLLAYCEAILRVYNLEGRRDNKYKARIKILMHEKGAAAMIDAVEAEFAENRFRAPKLDVAELERITAHFDLPALPPRRPSSTSFDHSRRGDRDFNLFVIRNVFPHRVPGYGIVTVSLKPIGGIPGDATAEQMETVASLAEQFSCNEIRVTHAQNLVLPHVRLDDLPTVHAALIKAGLGTPNAGLVTDIIACPGLDYCSLANARSISVAQSISQRFANRDRQQEIGDLQIKISGCINACGHHHVGHIGILGVDRLGEEFYQITLGGSADETCAIGTIVGRGFSADSIVDAVETIIETFLRVRLSPEETFLAAYRRLGSEPFRSALYGEAG
jgi:sulfite reductase (NADPH) hemoprotein beta-component